MTDVKRLLQVIGLLFIGVMANVTMACAWAVWGLPPHPDAGRWSISHQEPPFWFMHEFSGPGASVVRVTPEYRTGMITASLRTMAANTPDVRAQVIEQFASPPTNDQRDLRFGFDERGWPLRSMRSRHTYRAGDAGALIQEVEVVGGIQLWRQRTKEGGWGLQRVRAVPLIPIWSGFIINSLLYALLAAILIVGYPAMIRTLGRRRAIKRAVIALSTAPVLVVVIAMFAASRPQSGFGARFTGVGEPGQRDAFVMHAERQDDLGRTRMVLMCGPGVGTPDFDGLPNPPLTGVCPMLAGRFEPSRCAGPEDTFGLRVVETSGWPARAMRSSFDSRWVLGTMPMQSDVEVIAGIALDEPSARYDEAAKTLRILPTSIVWTGFMINWGLYGLILFGLVAVPAAARRASRRRKGLCPDCAYDLRGNLAGGCPECGAGRVR